MKKVAFFAEILIKDFDGASRTMFQLIDRIDDSGFEYFFIYGRGPKQFRDYKSYQVSTWNIPMNDDYHIAIPQLSRWKLERELDEFLPDIIHIATPSLLGFFALNYAKKRNIPVITIYHTHFISYTAYYLRNFTSLIKPTKQWLKRVMNNFYNSCDIVYVPTTAIADELKELGIKSSILHLWQRGIDTKLFNPSKRDRNFIQKITKNNKPNILFASRLVWEKNIQTLIQLYQLIRQEGLDYNFIIAGDGTAKEDAESKMSNAIFLGKQTHEDLAKLYASADVFVFTSISETYGNVVIEAMASGLPCVIANGGGSGSLVEHAVTGYKCTPDNPKEYLQYIKAIIEDNELKNSFKTKGLQYIKQLDWEKLAERYFDDVKQLSIYTDIPVAWAN